MKKALKKEPSVCEDMKDAWDAVKEICPRLHITFEYNQDEHSIELDNSFYICVNETQPLMTGCITPKLKKYLSPKTFCVSKAKYLPGDRETPPDVDIIDLQSFPSALQAVKFAIQTLKHEEIDIIFQDYCEMKIDEQEPY